MTGVVQRVHLIAEVTQVGIFPCSNNGSSFLSLNWGYHYADFNNFEMKLAELHRRRIIQLHIVLSSANSLEKESVADCVNSRFFYINITS